MINGQQAVFVQIPYSTDGGTTMAGSFIVFAQDISVTGKIPLLNNYQTTASLLFGVDSNSTGNFARLMSVPDDDVTQNSSAGSATNFRNLAVMARMQGFDGTSYRRLNVDTSGNLISAPKTSSLNVNATAAVNTAVTLTLPAAGAGLFHYITTIEIYRASTAALAGAAILNITTTNLTGLAWNVGNNMIAGGTQIDVSTTFASAVRSAVANTASTIVMPAAGAAVSWMANVHYYTGT